MPTRLDMPDRRDGMVYVMPENVDLAVRVALATGRPLLLRGDPGSGKSSLAAYLARDNGWRYYEHVVTSRTDAQDLLWSFDSIRRLADAQLRRVRPDHEYVRPGVLWWALARESAFRRGAPKGDEVSRAAEPEADLNRTRSSHHSVVLVDEIDKADPDVPNGLLVPLGSHQFEVTETASVVRVDDSATTDPRHSRNLIVVTTNEERELPQAFLRRCVVVWLEHPGAEGMMEIARRHLTQYEGGMDAGTEQMASELADAVVELRREAAQDAVRAPSTAEFLDALRACRDLGITPGSPEWKSLRDMALLKRQQPSS